MIYYFIALIESGNCMEGSVRLVNGSFTTEGRVEVCSNGIWGSICSNKFTAIDAYVICKELGYGLLGKYYECKVFILFMIQSQLCIIILIMVMEMDLL